MHLFEVKIRLYNWGRWRIKDADLGHGFPSQSTIVSALTGRSTAPLTPKDNQMAEEVDAIINVLKQTDARAWSVIDQEYTGQGTLKEKVRKLHMKQSDYYDTLNRGYAWVQSALIFNERRRDEDRKMMEMERASRGRIPASGFYHTR